MIFVARQSLSPSPIVLNSLTINSARTAITLTFSRVVVVGSVASNSITCTGADFATRKNSGMSYFGGTVVVLPVSGAGGCTAPVFSSWTGGTVPFVDTDGNRVASWTNRPCPVV